MPTLLLHILPDRFFTRMASDCAHVVSIRPKLAAPQLPFDLRYTFEHFSCCQALDNADDLGRTIGWYRLNKKMHMLFIDADLDELYLITLGYFQTNLFQHLIHFFVKDRPAILRWADEMIQQD